MLESQALPFEVNISQVSTWIYDSMALIQSINSQTIHEIKAQLAQYIFSLIIKHTSNELRVVTCTQMYQLTMQSDLEEVKVMVHVQEYFIVISPIQKVLISREK